MEGEGRHIEGAALLSHVKMLESRIWEGTSSSSTNFGHRKAPELGLCRIPSSSSKEEPRPILAMMAYTERCVSAQVMRESVGFSGVGPPVEVLTVSEEDCITCAILLPLENHNLAADDSKVVPDSEEKSDDLAGGSFKPKSLMSGGVIAVAPASRVAIVVGTISSRVISIEFSVHAKSLQMVRKTYSYVDKDTHETITLPYLEAFPRDRLTLHQEDLPKTTASSSQLHRTRRPPPPKNVQSKVKTIVTIVPFEPNGGVTSLVPYSVPRSQSPKRPQQTMEVSDNEPSEELPKTSKVEEDTYVWIGYGDGTGVRIHHAGLFPTVIQKHTDTYFHSTEKPLLEEILGQPLVKWQAHLPVNPSALVDSLNAEKMVVVPIPKYHPTPMAAATNSITPFPTSWNDAYQSGMLGRGLNTTKGSKGETRDENDDWCKDYEAIVYYKNNSDHAFPTLVFYSSEDQYPGRFQEDLQELLYGSLLEEETADERSSASNPIAALVGGIFGIFGHTEPSDDPKERSPTNESSSTQNPSSDELLASRDWEPGLPFPTIHRAPIDLYAGVEIHDSPRQITHCTVSPDGELAAVSDALGRVSLIDLRTKQITRMWKGYRETSCNWIQVPQRTEGHPPILFLVIHSRQRCVIEVWQMTHGTKVKSMQVGRDAQVIGCRQKLNSSGSYVHTCYVAHSNVPFSNRNQVEKIIVSMHNAVANHHNLANESLGKTKLANEHPKKAILETSISVIPSQEATARMNRLQQLLGETNVECQSVDVYKAMEEIESLEDLASCLDTIAMSPALEEKMGIDGSTFQRLALSLCQQKLDDAISVGGDESMTNPHVELLAFKIAYYTQICAGYDFLHKYEIGNQDRENHNENKKTEVRPPDGWGLEAAGWTSTYLKITNESLDNDVVPPPEAPMLFYKYASCLLAPKKWQTAEFDKKSGGYAVYLSDSSRTRRDMITRIFQPLIDGDVFSFKVVNKVFDSLGIKNHYEYKLKCFGEWFVGLPIKKATKKAVFAQFSPSVRWLKEIVSSQLDAIVASNDEEVAPMESLYRFCRVSEDLIRAFWLAALCRDTIYDVATDKENQTYGKVDKEQIILRWDTLLRQLRVCLLVSLRLHGNPLGACPLSVKAMDRFDNFSVFEWLAKDELSMSHNQDEISSLEIACQISTRAFDPSQPEGDGKSRWKTVQRSCLTAALGESERAEYLVDFDDDERLGALHLYLRPHNQPELLVAHRGMLLASKWGREPNRMDILEDALVAIHAIDLVKHKTLAYAVVLDVWQRQIRPIYRAMILGFDDVHEISSEVITPLLQEKTWVNSFSKLASEVLRRLADIQFSPDESVQEWTSQVIEDESTWPPVRDCFLLKRLVARNRLVDKGALEAHQTLVYALRINNDVQKLTECIPSFYDLFLSDSLFREVFWTDEIEEKQHEFMQDSIVVFAKSYHGPSMDSLNMGDIDALADLWDFDRTNVNTLFLLSMYEFGKDAAVDELLTKSASQISVEHFVDEGLDIMCRRLNNLLNVNPKDEIKEIMGTLDADICEWVKQKAEDSEPLLHAKFDVKIGSTHLFGLRLLSLAASADVSKAERIQIHSLIVLSGTIVKVLESSLTYGTRTSGVMGTPTKK